jgi:hypothetical protein
MEVTKWLKPPQRRTFIGYVITSDLSDGEHAEDRRAIGRVRNAPSRT